MKHSIFSQKYWDEQDIEQYIGKLLRYGVIIACTITTLGGLIYIFQHHSTMQEIINTFKVVPNDAIFSGAPDYLRELNTIVPEVFKLNGAAIIQFGVIVLIATPIIRVAFSAFSFLIEKDYMYVFITLIVLAIIISNMIFGFH